MIEICLNKNNRKKGTGLASGRLPKPTAETPVSEVHTDANTHTHTHTFTHTYTNIHTPKQNLMSQPSKPRELSEVATHGT